MNKETNFSLFIFLFLCIVFLFNSIQKKDKIKIIQDNILNIIMLMPLGVALPIVMNKKAKMWQACLVGVCILSVIEISQLVLKVGYFEL